MTTVRAFAALLCASGLTGSALGAETANPADAFAGTWARNSFNFEPMAGQPAPLVNMKRVADGTMDAGQIVGDYNNPLLKPEAAAIVRSKGDISKSGRPYPDPSNSCGPYQPPFTYAMELGLQVVPAKDHITMLYAQDDQVRRVRLGGTHPRNMKPSPMGDAVGHWEGDTLVVDIVGIQSFPYSMIDRFAVPVTKATHIVERYRLIDGAAAKQTQDAYEKREGRVGGVPGAMAIDPDVNLKGLQVEITVEDPTMYTRTWTATSTYRRGRGPWLEQVCAEDDYDPIEGKVRDNIPQAKARDF